MNRLDMWIEKLNTRLKSFRTKLIVAALCCIILPATVMLSIYNVLTKEEIEAEAMRQSEEQLMLLSGYVMNVFDYMIYAANYMQMDADLNTLLKELAKGKQYESNKERFEDRFFIISRLDSIKLLGSKVYATILLSNGDSFDNYGTDEYNSQQLWQEPWIDELDQLAGLQTLWLGAMPTVFNTEQTVSDYQLSLVRTLRGQGIHPYAYAVVTIMERQVSSILSELGDGEEAFIVDGHSKIVSHPNESLIGSLYKPASDVLGRSTVQLLRDGNRQYILASKPFTFTDWTLISLTPYEGAIASFNQIYNRVFISQLVTYSLFLVLFIYLTGTITRRLVHLGRVAEKVQRGNLEIRSHIRGEDEIGYVGRSFDQMLDQIKRMILEVSATHQNKREAELAMLQAQINPHFLFNVLNSIRMKVMRKGNLESAEMLSSLSKLLRLTISNRQETLPLHEEAAFIADYVKLMNMRQRQQVELVVELAAETLLLPVPKFCLQPIIENAMIHGLTQRAGTIMISAHLEQQFIAVTVADDGIGMDEKRLFELQELTRQQPEKTDETEYHERQFSSIGLHNVVERMRLKYGERFHVTIDSEIDKGTSITFYIPSQAVNEDV